MKALDPRRLAGVSQDLAAIAGAGCIAHGVDLVCRPAAFMVVGCFLLGTAWLSARRAAG